MYKCYMARAGKQTRKTEIYVHIRTDWLILALPTKSVGCLFQGGFTLSTESLLAWPLRQKLGVCRLTESSLAAAALSYSSLIPFLHTIPLVICGALSTSCFHRNFLKLHYGYLLPCDLPWGCWRWWQAAVVSCVGDVWWNRKKRQHVLPGLWSWVDAQHRLLEVSGDNCRQE